MLRSRIRSLFNRITTSKILRSSSALMVSNLTTTGVSLALSVVLARTLGAEDYGLIILAMTIVNGVTQFLDIQSDDAIVKFMGEAAIKGEKQTAISYFYIGLIADGIIMVVTMVVLLIAMPLISTIYGNNEILILMVRIYILSLPLSLLDNIFGTMLVVFKQFSLLAGLAIVNSIVRGACVIAFALSGNPVTTIWGYVIASAIVFIEQVGLGIYVLNKHLGTFRGGDFKAAARRFLPFVFHTNLAGYLKSISTNIDVLLLGVFRPAAEISFYKIARNASQLITLPISPVGTVIYPNLNEAWAKNNIQRARQLIWRYIAFVGGITISITLVLFAVADLAVGIIYGAEFAPVANLVRILAVGAILGQVNTIGQPVMFARGKPEYNTLQKLEASLLRVVFYLILIPTLGAIGAAIGLIATNVIVMAVLLLGFFPALGIWSLSRDNGKRMDQPVPK